MSVAVFPLGPLETNCYIVSNEGQAVAIDVLCLAPYIAQSPDRRGL